MSSGHRTGEIAPIPLHLLKEGSTADAPPPVNWPPGLNIRPDINLSMPRPFRIPAKAAIDAEILRCA